MYLNSPSRLLSVKPGTYIVYWDLNGVFHKLKYVQCKWLVRSIIGQPESPQMQFEDERGAIVHIPVNVWAFTGVQPYVGI